MVGGDLKNVKRQKVCHDAKSSFHFRLLHLKDRFQLRDTFKCFNDYRCRDDIERLFENIDEWESDEAIPNFTFLGLARLRLEFFNTFHLPKRKENDQNDDDRDTEVSNEDDQMFYHIEDEHEMIKNRLWFASSCIIFGIIELHPISDNPLSTTDGLTVNDVDLISWLIANPDKEDVDGFVKFIGARFANEESRCIFRDILKRGESIYQHITGMRGSLKKEAVIRRLTKWEKQMHYRMNREKEVEWTCTLNFFLRWQTRWNSNCWQRCLHLSHHLCQKDVKYKAPFWDATALAIIDMSMDEKERMRQNDNLEEQRFPTFSSVMGMRPNWPLLFMNMIREFAFYGATRWKNLCTGISIFVNSMIRVLSAEVCREFLSDVCNTFLSTTYFYEILVSEPILEMLKALLARTYLPSIYGGLLKNEIEATYGSAVNVDEDGYNLDYNNEHVQDLLCDPLFQNGQLANHIDLGLSILF